MNSLGFAGPIGCLPVVGRPVLLAPVSAVDIYADAVIGLDTNPGTALLPVRTLSRALALLPLNGWLGHCRVHLSVGIFDLPSIAGLPGPAAGGEPVTIDGTFMDSGFGLRTATGTTGGARNCLVTDAAIGPLVVDAWAGRFLRWTSGNLSGERWGIATNGVNTFSLLNDTLVAGPAPGDQYFIESPGTVLRTPNLPVSARNASWSLVASCLAVRGCVLSLGAWAVLESSTLYLESCWQRADSAATIATGLEALSESAIRVGALRYFMPGMFGDLPDTRSGAAGLFASAPGLAARHGCRNGSGVFAWGAYIYRGIPALHIGCQQSAWSFYRAVDCRWTANGAVGFQVFNSYFSVGSGDANGALSVLSGSATSTIFSLYMTQALVSNVNVLQGDIGVYANRGTYVVAFGIIGALASHFLYAVNTSQAAESGACTATGAVSDWRADAWRASRVLSAASGLLEARGTQVSSTALVPTNPVPLLTGSVVQNMRFVARFAAGGGAVWSCTHNLVRAASLVRVSPITPQAAMMPVRVGLAAVTITLTAVAGAVGVVADFLVELVEY